MKIIDLLNKIANGEEVPVYVRYINFVKNKEDIMMVCKENIIYKLDQLEIHLNDEVEIIEKEKKIPEKLGYCKENTFMEQKETTYLSSKERILLDSNFKELGNKINEIIDYFKSKGE